MSEVEKNTPDSRMQTLAVGSSENLSGQYKVIGAQLLLYEASNSLYRADSSEIFATFRQGVAFVSTEVLESYLEDLLDLEVRDEDLGIPKIRSGLGSLPVIVLGVLSSLGMELYANLLGADTLFSFVLTLVVLVPFVLLWKLAPGEGLVRRMGFAQILSHEISRRRGTSDTSGRPKNLVSPLRWSELLKSRLPRSVEGAAFTPLP